MAAVRPLILDSGRVRELRDTDLLLGVSSSGGGGSAPNVPLTINLNADNELVVEYLASFAPAIYDGELLIGVL